MHDDKDMSKYAGEELELAVKEVQGNHMEKWEAINMLKYVLSSIHYPWIIKSHSLNLMLILSGEDHVEEINNHVDFTCFAHRIFETLKVSLFVFIKNVVIFVFYCINILVTFIGHWKRYDCCPYGIGAEKSICCFEKGKYLEFLFSMRKG